MDTSSDTIDEEIRIRLLKLKEVPEEVEMVAEANPADEEIENRLLRLKFFRQTWCAKSSLPGEVAVRESIALKVESCLATPQSPCSSAPALSQPNFPSSSAQNLPQSQPCDCMNTLVEEVRALRDEQTKDRVQQNSDLAPANNTNMMNLQGVVLVLVLTFLKLLCHPKFKLRLQFVPATDYSFPSTAQSVTSTPTASTTSGYSSVLSSMNRFNLVLSGRVRDEMQGVVVDYKARLVEMLQRNVGTVRNTSAQFMTTCAKMFEKASEKIKTDEN